jgi:hypothetical protein
MLIQSQTPYYARELVIAFVSKGLCNINPLLYTVPCRIRHGLHDFDCFSSLHGAISDIILPYAGYGHVAPIVMDTPGISSVERAIKFS